jgi:thioredoxin reductase (NADPH)
MTRPPGEAELRPVIVTVDDDPGVSRAVARDLRRRYGERNRIVRAESGEQALEALRQMKLRGDQVAVLVADYRMPGLTGIEFLERAMDVYPYARRVLLTAYADTSAAIDAINIVDLDHYLLKPWDPPEEKLYPVIDELLKAWQREDRKPVKEAKLIGHRWSAPSADLRDFLARNQVPYRWYASDTDEGQRLLAAAGADGRDLPVLITADGEPLIRPTNAEVAAKVNLSTMPTHDFYDLIVVGGGPAGLGAAVYGASEGLRTVLVEKYATGGQAGQSSRIENYLGFPDGVSGGQLTDRARRQAVKFGAELLTTCEAAALEVNGSARTLRLSDGGAIGAKAVILATGVSYRQLHAPGCTEMTGAGVFYGAALTEAEACKDQDVYVVGGANSAGQAAVYLARFARSVTMLVRARSLEQSMSFYLVQQIAGIPNITVRVCTEVAEAHGNGHLEQLTLRDLAKGSTEIVDASQLFIFIGAAPRTGWLDGVLARDQHGFVLAGPDFAQEEASWPLDRQPYHLETSVPGVFVAGDVRSESAKRVASAVGEGAMAVMFVHRYLETLLPGERYDSNRAMRPSRAALAFPLREAVRRAAGPALRRGPHGDPPARAGLRRGRPGEEPLRADRGHAGHEQAGQRRRRGGSADQPARRLHRRLHGLPGGPGSADLPELDAGFRPVPVLRARRGLLRADHERMVPDAGPPARGPVLRRPAYSGGDRPAGAAARPRLAHRGPDPRT